MTTGEGPSRDVAAEVRATSADLPAADIAPDIVPGPRQRQRFRRPDFSRRLARIIAIALLALWAVWAAVAWTVEPRHVSVDQFRQDVATGSVDGFQVASGRERLTSWPPFEQGEFDWKATPTGPSTAAEGEPDSAALVIYWTDAGVASVRYLDVDETDGNVSPFVEQLRSAHISDDASDVPAIDHRLQRARPFAVGMVLLSLILVVLGPVPKRGTRWAWFFIIGTSFGLGVVGYAVMELWRAGAPVRVVVLRKVARVKWRGWEGYLLSLVGTTVANLTAWGLSALLGTWWIPAG